MTSRDGLWHWVLGTGLALTVLYGVAPTDPVWLRELTLYSLVECGAIAAIVIGVRRYRPVAPHAWLLIAGGLTAFLIGDVIWSVYEVLERDPFPSVGDVFYLAGYPLIAGGLIVGVVRRRPFGVDRRAWIDAGVITVIAGLLAWVYMIQPVLDDPDLSRSETLVTLAYPIGDLLLVAVAARFVVGSSWSALSLRLLVVGLGLTLVGDVMFALSILESDAGDRVVNSLLLAGVVLIGLAGLHPSMGALTQEAGDPAEQSDAVRAMLLAGALIVPPVVVIVQDVRGEPLYLGAALTAMVLMAVLVAVRLQFITGSVRRAARRESTLSRYAAELLAATGPDELFAAAGRAAADLAGDGRPALIVGAGSHEDHAFAADVVVRDETVATLVADPGPARLRRVRDSLTTVAAQLSLALERNRLLAVEREAAEALGEQNERLRELDRMKDSFVSSVSHELRTPLTSMVGYLEILCEGEAGTLTEEQARFLEIVDRNCHRLKDLIDDILFTAHLDSGRFTFERESVALGELAAKQVESIRATAAAKGVGVVLAVDDDLGPVEGDEMRLGQLLDNLLSNAVKFTPSGGNVTIDVGRTENTARLQVSDSGIGMTAEDLDRLFERFFRASTARAVPGTGLGLSIAKAITEAHGGTIGVSSEVDVGTTFVVDLPSLTSGTSPVRDAEMEVSP
ncbi:MAG: HAMP domain-containing sensor histidine kinase [Ilumatobacteraceae bacterium]